MPEPRACGRSDCRTSSGLGDEVTFGHGELSDCGYWEFGCEPCARAWEAKYPGELAWPFHEEYRAKLEVEFKKWDSMKSDL